MTHTCTKVTVRQRAIRNNRISLYLDYYPAVRNPETMQMSRREYLGIYIYAHPKNEMEREFNNGIELGNAQNGTVDLGRFSLDNMESVTLYNGQK